MILHIGGDTAVPLKEIIAIIDISSMTMSDINKEFLQVASDEDFIREVSEGEFKTFILTETNNKTAIYLSPVSTSTILRRSVLKT